MDFQLKQQKLQRKPKRPMLTQARNEPTRVDEALKQNLIEKESISRAATTHEDFIREFLISKIQLTFEIVA